MEGSGKVLHGRHRCSVHTALSAVETAGYLQGSRSCRHSTGFRRHLAALGGKNQVYTVPRESQQACQDSSEVDTL
jgi:hypothetical protein